MEQNINYKLSYFFDIIYIRKGRRVVTGKNFWGVVFEKAAALARFMESGD